MYHLGRGVRQDYKKAREYYEKAAALNYAGAFHHLGVMYEYGQGIRQDYKKAVEYYEKGAALNHAGAFYALGVMYTNGTGVTQDYKKARELYEKAAALKHAGAFNALGSMYEQGKGVKQDYKKAREYYTYYTNGFLRGDTNSKMNLARMNENGIGAKKIRRKPSIYTSRQRTEEISSRKKHSQDSKFPRNRASNQALNHRIIPTQKTASRLSSPESQS